MIPAFTWYFENHKNKAIQKKLEHLRPYHFKNVAKNIWFIRGKRNYQLAREATWEVITKAQSGKNFIDEFISQGINQVEFMNLPVAFGTTTRTMLMQIYGGSVAKATIDCLHNHPDKNIKIKYKDLKTYHFSFSTSWVENGVVQYDLWS